MENSKVNPQLQQEPEISVKKKKYTEFVINELKKAIESGSKRQIEHSMFPVELLMHNIQFSQVDFEMLTLLVQATILIRDDGSDLQDRLSKLCSN
jgi:hypothetical protein